MAYGALDELVDKRGYCSDFLLQDVDDLVEQACWDWDVLMDPQGVRNGGNLHE